MNFRTTRPAADEYGAYYDRYIQQIPAGHDPVQRLREQQAELHALFSGLSDEQARLRYAPGKWSIKETLVHVIDTERVFAYRALSIARGDQTPLPGFDQDAFTAHSGADARPLTGILREYDAQRAATLALLESLADEALTRRGTASGMPVSVRALSYMLPGHEAHHLQLWRERVWPLLG
ncbi:DinB family protein [Hymenobacter jeollabukensis]|uniref:DinB family protein n=1 Tax=Hymenobacter jeollabukensis TaxID=2025313 RepID=A0A5R8WN08_9BACT|nr:DinB family protein [Hymenobacter jeollabukensis]TLM91016.1 DinB family protein [Hymenobacter jeollabukensis]